MIELKIYNYSFDPFIGEESLSIPRPELAHVLDKIVLCQQKCLLIDSEEVQDCMKYKKYYALFATSRRSVPHFPHKRDVKFYLYILELNS